MSHAKSMNSRGMEKAFLPCHPVAQTLHEMEQSKDMIGCLRMLPATIDAAGIAPGTGAAQYWNQQICTSIKRVCGDKPPPDSCLNLMHEINMRLMPQPEGV